MSVRSAQNNLHPIRLVYHSAHPDAKPAFYSTSAITRRQIASPAALGQYIRFEKATSGLTYSGSLAWVSQAATIPRTNQESSLAVRLSIASALTSPLSLPALDWPRPDYADPAEESSGRFVSFSRARINATLVLEGGTL